MNIPEPSNNIQSLIDKHHESKAEHPRQHMGCSTLGHACDRWLWLSFRWAVQPKFPGRILRVFRRGQNEEATIIDDLKFVGITIDNAQTRVEFGSHVSGSLDGIIAGGVPEAPTKRHIAEFKTHSKKSFDDVEKKGVFLAKVEHWAQMQLYMHGTGIDRALYVAVCKDDDRIYTERVHYDRETAERYLERGKRLALSDRMPPPISTDPSWYQCKFCDAHEFCHSSNTTKHVNCRTCAHSTAKVDSTWHCERHKETIPPDFQRVGCDSHVLHPDMVPWKMDEAKDEWTAIYLIDNRKVANGENGLSSREILKEHNAIT